MYSLLLSLIFIAFISLGLPDALLGAAWPTMFPELNVSVSYAGIISMIISVSTVISSLNSDRLTKRFGTGVVTTCSVGLTALALFGFSISHSFWLLCLFALPYGLGAGSVDASLNNYVALHYESRHMNWLHCMWGVGVLVGPFSMGYALSYGMTWNLGYRIIGTIQVILTLVLAFSLPLWKDTPQSVEFEEIKTKAPIRLKDIIRIPGAKAIMLAFFCYCALEQTCILWGSTYLTLHCNFTGKLSAYFASLFCIGLTLGRAISGFMTYRFSDTKMIYLGIGTILFGIVCMLIPIGQYTVLFGLFVIGFGCAPIYPCIIHSTPTIFGKENSQAVIGVEMASAYVGTTLMPPLFGVIAEATTVSVLPAFLLIVLVGMLIMFHKSTNRIL